MFAIEIQVLDNTMHAEDGATCFCTTGSKARGCGSKDRPLPDHMSLTESSRNFSALYLLAGRMLTLSGKHSIGNIVFQLAPYD